MSLSRTALRTSVLVASLMLAGLATVPAHATPAAAASAPAGKAQQQLDKLSADFYQARVKFDPLQYATINGDSRYDDQLGITISPKLRAKQFAIYHRMQKQLKAIPRAGLSDKAQLNYDYLAFELQASLDMEPFPEHLLPLNQLDNVPSTLAVYASGTGNQPLTTPAQYDAFLKRLDLLPAWIDQAIANMKEGVRVGVVQPKSIITAMLPQFQAMRSKTVEENLFYTPVKILPATFSDADKQRISAAYRKAVSEKLMPALDRLATYLEKDYLPHGRASTGYGDLPNGKAWYLARIKNNTNLALTPDEVHALGLREVARIQQQMKDVGTQLGYTGEPSGLAKWVADQPKFKPFTTDAQVLDAYRDIYGKVSQQLPKYFSLLPKAKLELQLEPELTRATASDHYTPLAADGSHPGVFWPVVNDPRQYNIDGMVTLFLHEGLPGHHLHAALLKELDLPDYRKFNTENLEVAAYTEGWALYSETLGKQFGLYEQPVYYFGHLNDEMLRAVRLVVDTGMHAKGWSREQAIKYAMDTLGYSEARARNQIERYMVWPAQALAYKIGALKILELRARAEKELGDKFSYAAFHTVVTGDGTLSLPILEQRVNAWIAASK